MTTSSVAREIVEAVVLALVVFLVIQAGVKNFKVLGASMQPTLENGQYLLVNKLVYFELDKERIARLTPFWQVDQSSERFAFSPPSRGDVVVFHYPRNISQDFVKRLIALPGETVEIRSGVVYVNGTALDEPYLTSRDMGSTRPYRLAEDEYFVIGDNRKGSHDSRSWGPVPEDLLLGKVWFVYWPLSEWGLVHGSE